jgi:hypothetical protein
MRLQWRAWQNEAFVEMAVVGSFFSLATPLHVQLRSWCAGARPDDLFFSGAHRVFFRASFRGNFRSVARVLE